MRLSVRVAGADAVMQRLQRRYGSGSIDAALEGAARRMQADLRADMPVDTGAARRSVSVEVNDDTLQVRGLEYIRRLNEGSSRQAPAGFVDVIVARHVRALQQVLARGRRG